MSLIAAFQNFFDTVETGVARTGDRVAAFSSSVAKTRGELIEFQQAVDEVRATTKAPIDVGVGVADVEPSGNVATGQVARLRDAIDAARRMR